MANTDIPFQDENCQPVTIFSIGHSNQSIETFFALLRQYEIEVLVDVRSSPYSKYVPHFNSTAQRSLRLTEDGIHSWFRTLKQQATSEEWELIKELSFHDLCHDFAHRAREAGWALEEIAYLLSRTCHNEGYTCNPDDGSVYAG